jgi:hypothetical protein
MLSASCFRSPVILLLAVGLSLSCAPAMRSTIGGPPSRHDLAALWVEPGRGSDLDPFFGPGGANEAPQPDVVYRLVEEKPGGFSPKMEVADPGGRKWSVKLGPEAQAEVASSRILWLLGYRQPPEYYLEHWRLNRGQGRQPQHMGPGRFRPHLDWVKSRGTWSWHQNPFVESDAFRGLIVLMMVLNSTDLKDDNNEVYRVRQPGGPAEEWYAVKDLGASLGETGRQDPRRNDIDLFEKQAFVTGVRDGHVRFEFHGRHQELLRNISPADVRWMCLRLQQLSPREWHEAFRAAGYDEATAGRYVAKIQDKIRQGTSLSEETR